MNGKEQKRAMILTGVVEGRLTTGEAAELMSLSGRQERRLRQAFVRDGPAALVHGNRGRRPVHALAAEVRCRWLTLVGAIDDATGDVPYAVFRDQEDAQGYLMLLREVVRRRGVPLALYSDRHTIFQSRSDEPLTLEEQLAAGRLPTQVGRVLKELHVEWIGARSPQAKGRVERLWRTLQDRLCQELSLANVSTLEGANAALPALLARHNARFRQRAATGGSAYRRLPAGLRPADVFCFRYWRTVSMDNVVTLEGRAIPIPPGPHARSYARARVEVREHLDGSASAHYQGRCIARQGPQPADLRTKRRGTVGEQPAPPTSLNTATPRPVRTRPTKPAPGHPWRRSIVTA